MPVDPVETLNGLALRAMKVVADYLDHPAKQKDPDARAAARIATSVLSTWGTVRQALNGEEAMRVMIAREMTGPNGDKFKRALLGAPERKALR
jgi:hypothetical protein